MLQIFPLFTRNSSLLQQFCQEKSADFSPVWVWNNQTQFVTWANHELMFSARKWAIKACFGKAFDKIPPLDRTEMRH